MRPHPELVEGGAVPAGTRAALGRGLQRAAVEDGGRGTALSPGEVAQQEAQIVHHGLKDAGLEPAHRLLVDDLPGREVGGHQAPGGAGAHQPFERVEHLAQLVTALPPVARGQGEIRSDKAPFFVAHI